MFSTRDAKHPLDLTKHLGYFLGRRACARTAHSTLQTQRALAKQGRSSLEPEYITQGDNQSIFQEASNAKPLPHSQQSLGLPHDPSHAVSSSATPAVILSAGRRSSSMHCLAALSSELFNGKSQVGCNSNSNKQKDLFIYL